MGAGCCERVEISNARIVSAGHPLESKNGRPIFRLAIPAHASATLRYQVRHSGGRARRLPLRRGRA